jgi:hypothetical protein
LENPLVKIIKKIGCLAEETIEKLLSPGFGDSAPGTVVAQ